MPQTLDSSKSLLLLDLGQEAGGLWTIRQKEVHGNTPSERDGAKDQKEDLGVSVKQLICQDPRTFQVPMLLLMCEIPYESMPPKM